MLAGYLARWVALPGRRVLDLGCGLGLPGLVAAHGGAQVAFVDTALPALRFVRASAARAGLGVDTLYADWRTLRASAQFDVIVAAEIVYDRDRFADLAAVFRRHLRPGGIGLLADGFRTDTRGFYVEFLRRGLATWAVDCRVQDEGRVADLRLVVVSQADA